MKLAVNVTADRYWAFLSYMSANARPLAYRGQHTTGCTFDSSCNTSRACSCPNQPVSYQWVSCQSRRHLIGRTLSHNLCTSASDNCLHAIRFSIHPSSVGIDGGSMGVVIAGASDILPTSSMLVSILFARNYGAPTLIVTWFLSR